MSITSKKAVKVSKTAKLTTSLTKSIDRLTLQSSDVKLTNYVKKYLSEGELVVLDAVFSHLSSFSRPYDRVDMSAFLQLFELSGIVGERMFEEFSQKTDDNRYLDFTEFAYGMAMCIKGSHQDKYNFLCRMLSARNEKGVSYSTLKSMLTSMCLLYKSVTIDPLPDLCFDTSNVAPAVDRLLFLAFDRDTHRPLNTPPKVGEILPFYVLHKWAGSEPISDLFFGVIFHNKFLFQISDRLLSNQSNFLKRSSTMTTLEKEGYMGVRHVAETPRKGLLQSFSGSLSAVTKSAIPEHSKYNHQISSGQKFEIYKRYFVLIDRFLYRYTDKQSLSEPEAVLYLGNNLLVFECEETSKVFSTTPGEKQYLRLDILRPDQLSWVFYCPGDRERNAWKNAFQTAIFGPQMEFKYTINRDIVLTSRYGETTHPCYLKNSEKEYSVKIQTKSKLTPSERDAIYSDMATKRIAIKHPCLLNLQDVFISETLVFFVTEPVAGGTLASRIEERENDDAPFNFGDATEIIAQVLEGLEHLHSIDIAHRNIKCESIIFERGDESKIKIGGFGNAAFIDPDHGRPGLFGSPDYHSPEMVVGHGYGLAYDMWCLGLVVYQMLCREFPLEGKGDPERINENIKRGRFKVTTDRWKALDENSKTFVRGLLCLYPEKRLTAAQALEHPWIGGRSKKVKHTLGGYAYDWYVAKEDNDSDDDHLDIMKARNTKLVDFLTSSSTWDEKLAKSQPFLACQILLRAMRYTLLYPYTERAIAQTAPTEDVIEKTIEETKEIDGKIITTVTHVKEIVARESAESVFERLYMPSIAVCLDLAEKFTHSINQIKDDKNTSQFTICFWLANSMYMAELLKFEIDKLERTFSEKTKHFRKAQEDQNNENAIENENDNGESESEKTDSVVFEETEEMKNDRKVIEQLKLTQKEMLSCGTEFVYQLCDSFNEAIKTKLVPDLLETDPLMVLSRHTSLEALASGLETSNDAKEGGDDEEKHVGRQLREFTKQLSSLDQNFGSLLISSALRERIFGYLFEAIAFHFMNTLVKSEKYCTPIYGMNMRHNLSQLEEWTNNHHLSSCFQSLSPAVQMTQLLQLDGSRIAVHDSTCTDPAKIMRNESYEVRQILTNNCSLVPCEVAFRLIVFAVSAESSEQPPVNLDNVSIGEEPSLSIKALDLENIMSSKTNDNNNKGEDDLLTSDDNGESESPSKCESTSNSTEQSKVATKMTDSSSSTSLQQESLDYFSMARYQQTMAEKEDGSLMTMNSVSYDIDYVSVPANLQVPHARLIPFVEEKIEKPKRKMPKKKWNKK